MGDVLDERALLTGPLYSYREVDHLAGVAPGTARHWLDGYSDWQLDGIQVQASPTSHRGEAHTGPSFLDLVEISVIGRLKEAGFSRRCIRDIVLACQRNFQTEHPLVTLRFKTNGKEIFDDQRAVQADVGRRKWRHAWNDFLAPFLGEIDYEDDLVRRWYPLGQQKRIVVDPAYGYGLPVVKGTGIRTELILERFQVGETIEEIAEDFSVTASEVEQALQFETRLVKRAA